MKYSQLVKEVAKTYGEDVLKETKVENDDVYAENTALNVLNSFAVRQLIQLIARISAAEAIPLKDDIGDVYATEMDTDWFDGLMKPDVDVPEPLYPKFRIGQQVWYPQRVISVAQEFPEYRQAVGYINSITVRGLGTPDFYYVVDGQELHEKLLRALVGDIDRG